MTLPSWRHPERTNNRQDKQTEVFLLYTLSRSGESSSSLYEQNIFWKEIPTDIFIRSCTAHPKLLFVFGVFVPPTHPWLRELAIIAPRCPPLFPKHNYASKNQTLSHCIHKSKQLDILCCLSIYHSIYLYIYHIWKLVIIFDILSRHLKYLISLGALYIINSPTN